MGGKTLKLGARISRSDAILIGIGPLVVLFIADGFFKQSLYAYSPAAFWIFDALKFVVLPAIVGWLLYSHFDIKPAHYGLRTIAENESAVHFLGLVIFLAVILAVVYYVTWHISFRALRPVTPPAFYSTIIPHGPLHFPVVLYFSLTAGVTEEIVCRGLPLLYLRERFSVPGRAAYVFVTALLFAAAHWENGTHAVAATFLYGIFSGILYLRLRDLWPFIGAHALIDLWGFA